jgi:dienelactone hydrolase
MRSDGNVVPLNPPADFDVMKWVQNEMPHPPQVDPKIEKVIKHMRGEMGVKKLGGVGYCFGGKYVCRWLKPGSIDVAYTAHPSFVEADELKAIKGPLSIAAAGTFIFTSRTQCTWTTLRRKDANNV